MRYDVSDKAFDIRTANKIKCKCGHKQKCIKEEVGLTKWEDIENE